MKQSTRIVLAILALLVGVYATVIFAGGTNHSTPILQQSGRRGG